MDLRIIIYLLGLFLGFTAGVPEGNDVYGFTINTIDQFAQAINDDTPVCDGAVGKEWVNKADVWVKHNHIDSLVNLLLEFLHTPKPKTPIDV